MSARVEALGRLDPWDGVHAVVAGLDAPGFAAADNLTHLGARVTVLDGPGGSEPGRSEPGGSERAGSKPGGSERGERATLLELLGATVRLEGEATTALPEDADVLVTSPSSRADAPLLRQAAARGVPVWDEAELAWRLRDPASAAPWLGVAGAGGTTTTILALEAVLRAAGLRSLICGPAGVPLVEAVMDPAAYDVLAVELSAAQLHHTRSLACRSSVVLSVGAAPPAWYAAVPDPGRTYAADLGRAYQRVERACVYTLADPATEQLVREAEVVEGARAIGLTLGVPAVGMVGVVDDVLADRAFVEERRHAAAELGTLGDLASPEPAFVTQALAAAALARSHGVPPVAVRDGLRAFRP